MRSILVVEDDPAMRRSLVLNLTARGYEVDETGNGEDAIRIAGRRFPDIVLVDLGLPSMSGLEVIAGLRLLGDTPIIVLSARGNEADKVEALDAGANDYVTKPFGVEELMARVRVAERLGSRRDVDADVVRVGDLTLDLAARVLSRVGVGEIHLTPIEWAMLTHLVRRVGAVVTQGELLRAIWGVGYEAETNYLRVHLANLRRKIEPVPGRPRYVITEPGVGYRFVSVDSTDESHGPTPTVR